MKFGVKIFSIAALAVVGASLADAQATGFGQGFVSATLSPGGSGLFLVSTTGTYQSLFDMTSEGSNWTTTDYWTGTGTSPSNPLFVDSYGSSTSGPQVGGSGVVVANEATNMLTFGNSGSADVTLTISAFTFGFGSGSAQTWNDIGLGLGIGEIYDTNGVFQQFSLGYGQSAGMGQGGNYALFENFDTYNGLVTGSMFGGNTFPGSASGTFSDQQTYIVTIAPGTTDTIVMVSEYEHESFSVTPGPAAVAPFAIGLLGVLRRRRKR